MTIIKYLETVKSYLLTNSLVDNFQIVRERRTNSDGHLRARLSLFGGALMEFSEYVQLTIDDEIQVITYSYHCADASGNLIVRWDNTPHFPDLHGFPHHKHVKGSATPQHGRPMDIFQALEDIESLLG